MVKYYYDKYNRIDAASYSDTAQYDQSTAYYNLPFTGKSKSYTFNKTTNKYSAGGGVYGDEFINVGTIFYDFFGEGGQLQKYTCIAGAYAGSPVQTGSTYKLASNNSMSYTTTRGSLVQANIPAEDGYYPVNGASSDGYWYVRGAVVATAPTTPGVFTQPTGTLETSDAKTISWGSSTDAEGNLSKYDLDVSINNGAWATIGSPTSPNFTYTIPTATTIKFRVRAGDSSGLYSAYRESSAYTVTKPMYYWSKYNNSKYDYYGESGWYNEGNQGGYYMYDAYKSYSFNSSNGIFTGTGGTWGTHTPPNGSVGYLANGGTLYKYTVVGDSVVSTNSKVSVNVSSDSRGSLIQSNIVGDDTAYPNNVRHSDGFWYVRGLRVNQSIVPPSAFTTPATGSVLLPNQVLTIAFGASAASSISTYEVEHRYNTNAWAIVGTHTNALTRAFTVTSTKTLTSIEFRVRVKNTSNVYSDYIYSETFAIKHNSEPTLILSTENNRTLYENDILKINGSSTDVNSGDVITIKYQINGEAIRTLSTYTSTGVQVAYSKDLQFKSSKLFDGVTEVTGALIESVQHVVRVWVEDNQGGKSAEQTRSFFIVANRAPIITMSSTTFPNFIWSAQDLDAGDAIVNTKAILNASVIRTIDNPTFPQALTIPVAHLTDGVNTLEITATDKLGLVTKKTFKLTKSYTAFPETQLTSVALEMTHEVVIKLTRPDGVAASKIYKILGGYSL